MKIPYTITPRSASLLLDGKMQTVDSSHANYQAVLAELRKPAHDLPALRDLIDVRQFVARATYGRVQVSDAEVRFDGRPMHGHLVDRLIDMLRDGYDLEPLANFLANVLLNPVKDAADELFLWLERGQMPITPDGHFIAFKRVNNDYMDFHSLTTHYPVGGVVEKKINRRESIFDGQCGHGLHFCSYGYLRQFHGGQGRVLIVKINPADVIGIDKSETTKGQTVRMEVLSEMNEGKVQGAYEGKRVVEAPRPMPVEQMTQPVPESVLLTGLDDARTDMSEAINDALQATEESPVVTKPAAVKTVNKTTKNALTFAHGGVTYTAKQIRKLVEKSGYRGAAKEIGIAKSTLQGWHKKIIAAS